MEQHSPLNRTIRLSETEKEHYLKQCLTAADINNNSLPLDRIICGDAFEIMDLLPEKCIDLLIADPPYNLTKSYNGELFAKMPDEDYRAFIRAFIEKSKRLLKDTASVYICCDWKSSLIISGVCTEHFYVRNRITWQREKGRGSVKNWKNCMEDIWYATVSKTDFIFNAENVKQRRLVNAPYRVKTNTDNNAGENISIPKGWEDTPDGRFRDTYPSNFWDDITVPYWSMNENTDHPAQKAEKLAAKLILASSNPGDTVFDPFGGSGTAAVTAKKLNRRFLSIEKQEEYSALSVKRLETAKVCKTIQGYSDGVFWERNTGKYQK
jgi:site-specific DNA-methyltransferase (adenine-specific)